jgi:hypothetical protein
VKGVDVMAGDHAFRLAFKTEKGIANTNEHFSENMARISDKCLPLSGEFGWANPDTYEQRFRPPGTHYLFSALFLTSRIAIKISHFQPLRAITHCNAARSTDLRKIPQNGITEAVSAPFRWIFHSPCLSW